MLCIALWLCQKLGMILVNKVVLKLKLPNNYLTKNVLLKLGKAFMDAFNQGGWLIL